MTPTTTLDLNCDLGEGEALGRTRALMQWVTSANVACGGHAGNLRSMEQCVRLARSSGTRLGAHPGVWSRADFGRSPAPLSPHDLRLLLLHQVGALEKLGQSLNLTLHHIKLHGALYHASDQDPALARAYVNTVRCFWPNARIYARAGGGVVTLARRLGVAVWEEAFLDRAYLSDGNLVPRSERGAVITGLDAVRRRVEQLGRGEGIAIDGASFPLRADTLCIHSDTITAVRVARLAAKLLGLRPRERG